MRDISTKTLVEYFWDEASEMGEFIYENDITQELTQERRHKPLPKPDPNPVKYFAELEIFLGTQGY